MGTWESPRVIITTPVPMRANPTVTLSGALYLLTSENPNTYTKQNLISEVVLVSIEENRIRLGLKVGNNGHAISATNTIGNGSGVDSYIDFDSNL